LGAISEVLRGPAQDVWVIRGPYGEVMLPAVDEVVLGVSDDAPIEVRAPEGSVSREDL
jgi:16S rRNA processing protein RimM